MKLVMFLFLFLIGCGYYDTTRMPSLPDIDRDYEIREKTESKYLTGEAHEEWVNNLEKIFKNQMKATVNLCSSYLPCFQEAMIEPIKDYCWELWFSETGGPADRIKYKLCVSKLIKTLFS